MCGIIGGVTKKIISNEVLNSIEHRGPDSNGLFIDDKVFLGHTRLSIQDLSNKANQPMLSECKNFVIIFNGEIYNHNEIRREHLQNIDFNSSGDTETLLRAYIKYGESCLELLNGIFAFAIYNISKREFFIVRDQFGVKPLYIYRDKKEVIKLLPYILKNKNKK